MKITQIKIDELVPYELNIKDHPKEQIELLAQSIQEFWFNTPVIVDKNNVLVAGHGRVEAARLAWLTSVPAIVKSDLTEKQIRKYRLLDNRISEMAKDNLDNLRIELAAIGDIELSELFDVPLGNLELNIGEEGEDLEDSGNWLKINESGVKYFTILFEWDKYKEIEGRIKELYKVTGTNNVTDLFEYCIGKIHSQEVWK